MLTDVECKNATCPPDKRHIRLADAGGLYLEVAQGGSKRWFYKYRIDGKEKRLALGSYPVVKLPAARQGRDEAKAAKRAGADPVQAKQMAKAAAAAPTNGTFKDAGLAWLALHKENWSETHYVREQRNLQKDLFPFLGSLPIRDITTPLLLATIKKVEARGVRDVPGRVLLTARGVWQYAEAAGLCPHDITPNIKKALKSSLKKNLPAIVNPTELAELLRASGGYRGGPVVRTALQLAPILFQRPGNLRTMRWRDLDLENKLWTIPSEEMKRKKEEKLKGQPHLVPLPRQAVALLRELEPLTGAGVYVFPGLRDRAAPMSEASVSAALHSMGYRGRHTWHGFRATGRTLLREALKYPVDVIEMQLAHYGQIKHAGAYDRATFIEERAAMLQHWADYLDGLAGTTSQDA